MKQKTKNILLNGGIVLSTLIAAELFSRIFPDSPILPYSTIFPYYLIIIRKNWKYLNEMSNLKHKWWYIIGLSGDIFIIIATTLILTGNPLGFVFIFLGIVISYIYPRKLEISDFHDIKIYNYEDPLFQKITSTKINKNKELLNRLNSKTQFHNHRAEIIRNSAVFFYITIIINILLIQKSIFFTENRLENLGIFWRIVISGFNFLLVFSLTYKFTDKNYDIVDELYKIKENPKIISGFILLLGLIWANWLIYYLQDEILGIYYAYDFYAYFSTLEATVFSFILSNSYTLLITGLHVFYYLALINIFILLIRIRINSKFNISTINIAKLSPKLPRIHILGLISVFLFSIEKILMYFYYYPLFRFLNIDISAIFFYGESLLLIIGSIYIIFSKKSHNKINKFWIKNSIFFIWGTIILLAFYPIFNLIDELFYHNRLNSEFLPTLMAGLGGGLFILSMNFYIKFRKWKYLDEDVTSKQTIFKYSLDIVNDLLVTNNRMDWVHDILQAMQEYLLDFPDLRKKLEKKFLEKYYQSIIAYNYLSNNDLPRIEIDLDPKDPLYLKISSYSQRFAVKGIKSWFISTILRIFLGISIAIGSLLALKALKFPIIENGIWVSLIIFGIIYGSMVLGLEIFYLKKNALSTWNSPNLSIYYLFSILMANNIPFLISLPPETFDMFS